MLLLGISKNKTVQLEVQTIPETAQEAFDLLEEEFPQDAEWFLTILLVDEVTEWRQGDWEWEKPS
jgi:hypothetical protein